MGGRRRLPCQSLQGVKAHGAQAQIPACFPYCMPQIIRQRAVANDQECGYAGQVMPHEQLCGARQAAAPGAAVGEGIRMEVKTAEAAEQLPAVGTR